MLRARSVSHGSGATHLRSRDNEPTALNRGWLETALGSARARDLRKRNLARSEAAQKDADQLGAVGDRNRSTRKEPLGENLVDGAEDHAHRETRLEILA